jgi:hypothetical protein
MIPIEFQKPNATKNSIRIKGITVPFRKPGLDAGFDG